MGQTYLKIQKNSFHLASEESGKIDIRPCKTEPNGGQFLHLGGTPPPLEAITSQVKDKFGKWSQVKIVGTSTNSTFSLGFSCLREGPRTYTVIAFKFEVQAIQ